MRRINYDRGDYYYINYLWNNYYFRFIEFIQEGEKMNANTRGALYVKADRINDRVDAFGKQFLREQKSKENERISIEDFMDFIKSIHLIVNTELNEKGVERKWKK